MSLDTKEISALMIKFRNFLQVHLASLGVYMAVTLSTWHLLEGCHVYPVIATYLPCRPRNYHKMTTSYSQNFTKYCLTWLLRVVLVTVWPWHKTLPSNNIFAWHVFRPHFTFHYEHIFTDSLKILKIKMCWWHYVQRWASSLQSECVNFNNHEYFVYTPLGDSHTVIPTFWCIFF